MNCPGRRFLPVQAAHERELQHRQGPRTSTQDEREGPGLSTCTRI